jgi:hypothetical protein
LLGSYELVQQIYTIQRDQIIIFIEIELIATNATPLDWLIGCPDCTWNHRYQQLIYFWNRLLMEKKTSRISVCVVSGSRR